MKKILVLTLLVMVTFLIFTGCEKTPKTLKVGTSADYPPFEYVDEKTGDFIGFDMDLIRLVGERLDMKLKSLIWILIQLFHLLIRKK